jgi:hypothetical protein
MPCPAAVSPVNFVISEKVLSKELMLSPAGRAAVLFDVVDVDDEEGVELHADARPPRLRTASTVTACLMRIGPQPILISCLHTR